MTVPMNGDVAGALHATWMQGCEPSKIRLNFAHADRIEFNAARSMWDRPLREDSPRQPIAPSTRREAVLLEKAFDAMCRRVGAPVRAVERDT